MSMSVLKKLSTILFPNTEEPYQISDPTAVKFDAQELTESQQMQARTNIAAVNNWEELGKKTGTVVILPESSVEIEYISVADSYNGTIIPEVFNDFVIGQLYTVEIDGKVYTSVAEENHLGQAILRVSTVNGNVNITANDTNQNYNCEWYDLGESPTTHTVFITTVQETITPIPPEYLPGTFVPTAIIKSSDYDNALAGVSTMASDPEASDASYECINMTFEEAMQYVTEGRQLTVCLMFVLNSIPTISNASVQLVSENGERFLYAYTSGSSSFGLVWKSDGLTKN